MTARRVIVCSPHVWDSPYRVGSHHYARCFAAAGWEVAYLSAPISPFHYLYHAYSAQRRKVMWPERWASWRNGGRNAEGLWTYVPFSVVPVATQFPFNLDWALNACVRATIPSIPSKLASRGMDRADVIWLDSPLYEPILRMIPHGRSVLRVADDLSGFSELAGNVVRAERRLVARVDCVVATSRTLEATVKAAGAHRVVHLPNGVDLPHFSGDRGVEPASLRGLPQPRILYVGSIESWFDDALLERIAAAFPQGSIIVVGDYKPGTYPSLERSPNVHFTGRQNYQSIPSFMQHADLGVIPFKRLPLTESVNPIKLYEYMAAGLPVVSTRWKTLTEMGSPALLADSDSHFVDLLGKALADRPRLTAAGLQFASENSWQRRFETVLPHLVDVP